MPAASPESKSCERSHSDAEVILPPLTEDAWTTVEGIYISSAEVIYLRTVSYISYSEAACCSPECPE